MAGIRLRDYGGPGRPLLVVPSLVNGPGVLDLMEGHGLLSHLAARGARPLLLDWGLPGPVTRGFTLTDYVAGPLERAAAAAARLAGGPVPVLGYCMGGTLAMALAVRRPDLVAGLALLAAPWDFAGEAASVARIAPWLLNSIAAEGVMPADALNAAFAMRDHAAIVRKFIAFGRADPATPRARMFVAIEDWLGQGVPVAAAVARECIKDWYGANTPGRGAWRIAGQPIEPAALACPVLCAIPRRDRIVPEASALGLVRQVPHATVLRPAAGHVGMVAGGGAEAALWRDLHGWLAALPVTERPH